MADIQDLKSHFGPFLVTTRANSPHSKTRMDIGPNALFACQCWWRGSGYESGTNSGTSPKCPVRL